MKGPVSISFGSAAELNFNCVLSYLVIWSIILYQGDKLIDIEIGHDL